MLHAGLDLSRKKLDICLLSESGEHLDRLAARDATLVPHDWGMHSLYWAIHHPERLRGLFILNTMAHRRREEIKLPLPIKLFRN